jgi:hypothetical protein
LSAVHVDDPQNGGTDERIPCPDELCTGTIGPSGRCNYCGRAASPEASPSDAATAPESTVAHLSAETLDGDERVPCVDDLCTGTVNERGTCNYCGRVHPGFGKQV